MADLNFDELPLEQQQRIRGRVYAQSTSDLEGTYIMPSGIENDNRPRPLEAFTALDAPTKNVIRGLTGAHARVTSAIGGVSEFEGRLSTVVGNEGAADQEAFESINSNLIQAVALLLTKVADLETQIANGGTGGGGTPTTVISLRDTRPFIASGSTYLVPEYKVGDSSLVIYWQGLRANAGLTYEEIGTIGEMSTQIRWLEDVEINFDVVITSFA